MSDLVEIFKKSKRFSRMSKRMSKRLSMEQLHIGPYDIIKFLKEGSSSQIYLAESRYTGETVTIKIINKSNIYNNYENLLLITKQIQALKLLKHRNIISLYEIYESKKNIFLITEYISGQDLVQKLIIKKRFSEEETKQIFFQLLDALIYMHKMKICHRNLRTEHILFDKNNRPKIIGFGYCDFYLNEKKLDGMYGSLCYVCPEILDSQKYDPELADIWSLGVILYVMICGYLPFSDEDDEKNKNLILNGKVDYPKEISNKVKDLLKHMLDINPNKRYNFQKILKHPWLKPYKESLFLDGINIYNIKYPIDDKILNIVSMYGFDKKIVKDNLLKNKFNESTGVYKQLIRKSLDLKINTISDLCSDIYLKYRSDPKNLISNKSEFQKYINNMQNIIKKKEKIVADYKSKEDYVAEQLIKIQNIQESRITENENINLSNSKTKKSQKLLDNEQDKICEKAEINYNGDDDFDLIGEFKEKIKHAHSNETKKTKEIKNQNKRNKNELTKSTIHPYFKKLSKNENILKDLKMTIKPNPTTEKFISKILNGTFFNNCKFRKSRFYPSEVKKDEKKNNDNHLEQASCLDSYLKNNHPDNVKKTLVKRDFLGIKMNDIFDDDENEKNQEETVNKNLRFSISFGGSDEDENDDDDESLYSNNMENNEKIMELLNNDPEFKELKDIYYGKKSMKVEKKNNENSKNNDNSNLSKNIRKSNRLTFGKSFEEKKENKINIQRKESKKGINKNFNKKSSFVDNQNNSSALNKLKKSGQKSGKSVRFNLDIDNINLKNDQTSFNENTNTSNDFPSDIYSTITIKTIQNIKNDDLKKSSNNKEKSNDVNQITQKVKFPPFNISNITDEINTDRFGSKFNGCSTFIFDVKNINNMKNIDNKFLFNINSLEQKRTKKDISFFNNDNKNKIKKFNKQFKKNINNNSIINDLNDINTLFYKKHFKKYQNIYPPEIKIFKNLKITHEKKLNFEKYENKSIDSIKSKKKIKIVSLRNNLNKSYNTNNNLDTNEIISKNDSSDNNENKQKIKLKNLYNKKLNKKKNNSVDINGEDDIMNDTNQISEEPIQKYKLFKLIMDDGYKEKEKIKKLDNYSSEKNKKIYNNNINDDFGNYYSMNNFSTNLTKSQSIRKNNKSYNKNNDNNEVTPFNNNKSIQIIKKISSKKHIFITKSKEKEKKREQENEKEIHYNKEKILKYFKMFDKKDKKISTSNKNNNELLEKHKYSNPLYKMEKSKPQLKRYEHRGTNIIENSLNSTASLEKVKIKKKLNNSAKDIKTEEIAKKSEIAKKIRRCQNLLNTIVTDKSNYYNENNNRDENYNTIVSWNIRNSRNDSINNYNNETEIPRRKYKKIKKNEKDFSINLNANNKDSSFFGCLSTKNKIINNRKKSVDDIQVNDYTDINANNNTSEINFNKNHNNASQLNQRINLIKKINNNIKNTTVVRGTRIKKDYNSCFNLDNNSDNISKNNKNNNFFSTKRSTKIKVISSFMGNVANENKGKINKKARK